MLAALPWTLSVAALAATNVAHADVYDEFTGGRSAAMGGAHRGLGDSNDAIVLNPAGMSIRPRYSIDGAYAYSGVNSMNHIHLSFVDSKTGPVAGAIGWTFDVGDHEYSNTQLHRLYLASSYLLFEGFSFGTTARYLRGSFVDEEGVPQSVDTYSMDAGVMLNLFGWLGIGVTVHNTFSTGRRRLNPPRMGIGLAYAGESLNISTDLEIDLRPMRLGELTYRLGAEFFLVEAIAIRAGYQLLPLRSQLGIARSGSPGEFIDITILEHVVGGGAGWVTQSGSVEFTYNQSITRPRKWDLIATVKLFF